MRGKQRCAPRGVAADRALDRRGDLRAVEGDELCQLGLGDGDGRHSPSRNSVADEFADLVGATALNQPRRDNVRGITAALAVGPVADAAAVFERRLAGSEIGNGLRTRHNRDNQD